MPETLARSDVLSISHRFFCSSSRSALVVRRLLASGLHRRNRSGNHFCLFNLLQDCGRESRHVPVVSVGALLFLLSITAGCVVLSSLTQREGSAPGRRQPACLPGQRPVTRSSVEEPRACRYQPLEMGSVCSTPSSAWNASLRYFVLTERLNGTVIKHHC